MGHGFDAHIFEVLHETDYEISQNALNEYERFYWSEYSSKGYEMLNLKEAYGSGGKLSNDTKAKLRAINLGSKSPKYGREVSKETRLLLGASKVGALNPRYGKPSPRRGVKLSAEQRAKISESRKGLHAGSKHPMAKLNENDVVDIWRMIQEGYSNLSIARLFNVSADSISRIKVGDTWTHVTSTLPTKKN